MLRAKARTGRSDLRTEPEDNGAATGTGNGSSKAVAAAVAKNGTGLSGGLLTALIAVGVLLVGGIVGVSMRALRSTEGD